MRHESDLKQAEFEDKKRTELTQERRKAYRTMSKITLLVKPAEDYQFSDLSEAYAEIQLLSTSPAVVDSARNLFARANEARKLARQTFKAGITDVMNNSDTRIAFEASQELRTRFLNAVGEELELTPLPPPGAGLIIPRVVTSSQPDGNSTRHPWWRRFFGFE